MFVCLLLLQKIERLQCWRRRKIDGGGILPLVLDYIPYTLCNMVEIYLALKLIVIYEYYYMTITGMAFLS